MKSGVIDVHVEAAEGRGLAAGRVGYVAAALRSAEGAEAGRQCTEPAEAGTDAVVRFAGDAGALSFDVAPAEEDCVLLDCMLYEQGAAGAADALLGQGTAPLGQLGDDSEPARLCVPLVDALGKASGEVRVEVRRFPGRSPGKGRDALGREVVDASVAARGARAGAAEANARSPKRAPRRRSAERVGGKGGEEEAGFGAGAGSG
jgi:hypothetical protein